MDKLINFIKSILGGFFSLLFFTIIIVMWSAQIKSCFTFESIKSVSEQNNKLEIIEASLENPKHRKLLEHMESLYSSIKLQNQRNFDVYFINEENSLNAASCGNDRYIIWETLADLPNYAIDCILAHEIAHNYLLHSRKMHDADDLRNFFTEVFSLIGGADNKTENILQEWSSKLTLPKYSQSQEYEADEYATEILFKCGYDNPQLTFSKTLGLIENKFGDSGGGFFDSHPSTKDRIQNVLTSRN